VIKRFGAYNEQTRGTRRYYFLIDESGKIIWESVNGTLIPIEKLLADLTAVVKPAGN